MLVGPTASGKTELLLRLFGAPGRGAGFGVSRTAATDCAAEHPCGDRAGGGMPPAVLDSSMPPAEVVSADSMQVYRGMDIGTAKPGADELARLPHHLIDLLAPSEQYSAGDFVSRADAAAAEIAARGALPVIAGGTGFYVKNFVCGLPGAPPSTPELRAQVARDLAALGPDALRAELASGDPVSAARIHEHDLYRLTRAVEILRATGRPLADFAAGGAARSCYRFLIVELTRPRAELYERIDARVDQMFERGLEAEAAALRAAGYGPDCPGMKAIGYREFFEAQTGAQRSVTERETLIAAIKQDSRRYAKRQETFFCSLPGLVRIEVSGADGTDRAARELTPIISQFMRA